MGDFDRYQDAATADDRGIDGNATVGKQIYDRVAVIFDVRVASPAFLWIAYPARRLTLTRSLSHYTGRSWPSE
jgi:hypothetical protein